MAHKIFYYLNICVLYVPDILSSETILLSHDLIIKKKKKKKKKKTHYLHKRYCWIGFLFLVSFFKYPF